MDAQTAEVIKLALLVAAVVACTFIERTRK